MFIDAFARSADCALPFVAPAMPATDLIGAPAAPAQPEFVEMVHIRTFAFDPLSMDDLDAFNLALTLSGPCIGVCADGTVSVLESQGEALLGLLKAKGLDFKYESSWIPGTEDWITQFYAPPVRDQDDWH